MKKACFMILCSLCCICACLPAALAAEGFGVPAGDDSHLWLWVGILAGCALLGTAAAIIFRNRR